MSALVGGAAASRVLSRHGLDAVAEERPAALARMRTFHTLDALRAVAAIDIVLFHAAFFYSMAPPAEGQLAVDLFFVMSGFIIGHRYEDELRDGILSFGRFAAIRFVRLYPLYLLGLLLGAVPSLVFLATKGWSETYGGQLATLPPALLMLPSRFALPKSGELFPLNYVAWSLSLEMAINLVFAATVRVWTTGRILALVAFAAVALAVCAAVYGTLHLGFDWVGWIGGPVRILFGFALGVLVHRAYRAAPERFPVVRWWVPLLLAIALFVLPPIGSRAVWEYAGCTLVVPLVAVLAIACEPPQRLQGACALAGIGSYVVYSLHVPLIGLYLRLEERVGVGLAHQPPLAAVGFTVLLAALCYVAHAIYDRPVRRAMTRVLKRRARA